MKNYVYAQYLYEQVLQPIQFNNGGHKDNGLDSLLTCGE